MSTERRVILYGDSLILVGVQASLENRPGLEVLVLDEPLEDPLEVLRRLRPAAIIFDLNSVTPDFPLAILQQPSLLLIGIDPATDRMLLWSGEHSRALSMQDLVQVIEASGNETRAAVASFGSLERLQRWVPRWTAPALTRKQTLAFALAGVALVVCLGLLFSSTGLPGNAPLSGAALGKPPDEMGLVFAAGVLLGGLALGLWLPRKR